MNANQEEHEAHEESDMEFAHSFFHPFVLFASFVVKKCLWNARHEEQDTKEAHEESAMEFAHSFFHPFVLFVSFVVKKPLPSPIMVTTKKV